jgi:hypothetical protein
MVFLYHYCVPPVGPSALTPPLPSTAAFGDFYHYGIFFSHIYITFFYSVFAHLQRARMTDKYDDRRDRKGVRTSGGERRGGE